RRTKPVKPLIGSLILACTQLAAQSLFIPAPGDCLNDADATRLKNSAVLEMSVALDRAEYLSGEVMTFTISLRNTGGQSVEVYDPWQAGGIGVEIATLTDNPNRLRYRLPNHAYAGVWHGCGGSGVWLQPGESLTRQVRSDQSLTDPDAPAISGGSAPLSPGPYVFAARYRNREVTQPFRVVRPVVEDLQSVKLGARYVYGYVVRAGDARFFGADAHP